MDSRTQVLPRYASNRGLKAVTRQLRAALQPAAAFCLFVVLVLFVRYRLATVTHELRSEIHELTKKLEQLENEQTMPAVVLERYRNSICYVSGIYEVRLNNRAPAVHAQFSGTGFVVTNGLVATVRHVAEPWYRDKEDAALLRRGATAHLEKMLAFFPDLSQAVNISPAVVSAQEDVAVLRIDDPDMVGELRPVPLADKSPSPGELVSVVGYPMGVFGMLAKSPRPVYDRLVFRHDDRVPAQLASLSLIRPSATCGHLGDVVGEKLIYDAPTAPGASGGPIFNSHGEVIGVNAAYVDGFSGGTLGISIRTVLPLIASAGKR